MFYWLRMQFINNAIGGQPVVAAVVCYPESVVRSPKAVRDPQPQYGAHLLHVTIFFPAADSRRISCIYEIKHKVASRLVLYLLPFAAAHLAHMTAEIFSKRGEAAGAENHTHGPAPKKREYFYAFPVKSEVEIKIQKEGRWACRDYHAISGRSGLPEWYPHVTLLPLSPVGAGCGRVLFPTSC